MILQALHALYARLKDDPSYEVAPPGYSIQKISFKVVLHPDGRLFAIQSTLHDGRPKQVRVPGSAKPPGSGLNPCFLWDNTGYMLGYKPDDQNPARTREAFEAFRAKHLALKDAIAEKHFKAVCRFLDNWNPAQAVHDPVLAETKTGFGVFQMVGEPSFVHESAAVDAWWRNHLAEAGEEEIRAQCLLTGSFGPVARLQPMIKGVAGGNAQSSLVGFNDSAFWSYGKEQSFNAPVSERAAAEYGAALNALLDGPLRRRHRILLGDATLAFWTDRPSLVEDVFAQFAERGSDLAPRKDEVQDATVLKEMEVFLDALRQGIEKAGDLGKDSEGTKFYLLGLSPNQGRVAVRFFHQGSVKELIEHLREHHRDIGIERQFGEVSRRPEPEFPPTWMLLRQTGREADDIPPNLSAPLLRAILTGCRYPESLLAAVIRRIRADREVNYLRASVIKGCLIRNHGKEIPMSLDTSRSEPAYRLGRLFAALEKAQEDALGGVNASIRDRFYSSASATPAAVFPRLLRTYQHHLGKLEGGLKIVREKLVQEILDPLKNFPANMGLADQGLFALGYYHQRHAFYTKKPTETKSQEE